METSKYHTIMCTGAQQNSFLFWGRMSLTEGAAFG